MSLVLEALKKLEREKGRDERGFLVMAATPWPAGHARRWPIWVAAGVAAGAAAAILALRVWAPAPAAPAPPPSSVGSGVSVPALVPAPVRAEEGPRSTPPPALAPAAAPPPAATAPASDPGHGLRLQAITWRDGQPIAMVSDRLVRVGDEFEGVRVLAIRDAEVDVEVRGRRATLRF